MSHRTASRAVMFGPLFTDSVLDDLDDLDTEAGILADAYAQAALIAYDEVVYEPIAEEIQDHLAHHPAF